MLLSTAALQASDQVFNYIKDTKYKVDFLVVGPISEEAKRVSGKHNNIVLLGSFKVCITSP